MDNQRQVRRLTELARDEGGKVLSRVATLCEALTLQVTALQGLFHALAEGAGDDDWLLEDLADAIAECRARQERVASVVRAASAASVVRAARAGKAGAG